MHQQGLTKYIIHHFRRAAQVFCLVTGLLGGGHRIIAPGPRPGNTCFRGAGGSDPRMAGRLPSLCLRVLGGGQRLAPGGHLGLTSSQQRLNPGQFLQSRFVLETKNSQAIYGITQESTNTHCSTTCEDCPGGGNGADTDCYW